MDCKEVIKILLANGWIENRQVGSHKHFKKDGNPNIVTVPMHGKKDIPLGTLKNIFKKADIEDKK